RRAWWRRWWSSSAQLPASVDGVALDCLILVARVRGPGVILERDVRCGGARTMAEDSAGIELWDLWYPSAGATGLPFARGRIDATEVLWVHAAPEVLSVRVRSDDDTLVARGSSLRREG